VTGVVQRQRQSEDDGCPGALRPHHAADGELLRLRVPGGALGLTALRALAVASTELADGRIGLTSRGNLQVRGVVEADVEALVQRVRGAGLLPGAEHERVRNIVASPLSGRRSGSRDDVDPLVHDLDAALCARPALARLPGRFLFAVDDGSGDVQAEGADVLAIAVGNGQYAVRLPAVTCGLLVGVENVVAAMLAAAESFLAERVAQDSRAWRIAELDGGGAPLVERLKAAGWPTEEPGRAGPEEPEQAEPERAGPEEPEQAGPEDPEQAEPERAGPEEPGQAGPALEPGLIEQRDGRFAVCAGTPLGLLNVDQVAALAAGSELSESPPDGPRGALRITPWRRVVVRDLQLPAALAVRELLSSVGLVVEPGTAWSRLTACAGRPGCAKSLTDVHADVRAFAAVADPAGPALHWAGCERGCGTPAGPNVVRVVATTTGYRVSGADDGAWPSPRDLAAIRIEAT
jgi:precorrin-3B synthase